MKVDVPKYLNTDDGKAFLCISADVFGKWCAGYHRWYDDGTYAVVDGMYINSADTIKEALKQLKEIMNAST